MGSPLLCFLLSLVYLHDGLELALKLVSPTALVSDALSLEDERGMTEMFNNDMRFGRLAGDRSGAATLRAPTGAETLFPEPEAESPSSKLERNFGDS